MKIKIPQIGKNISWSGLNYLINAICAFYLTPFMIRTLGNFTFGIWVLAGSLLGYYSILNLGFDTAIIRHVAKYLGEKNEQAAADILASARNYFRGIGIFVVLISSGAAALFAFSDPAFNFFFADKFDPSIRNEFALTILLLGATTALSFYMRLWSCVLSARERYDIPAMFSTLTLLMRTVCLFLFLRESLLSVALIFSFFSVLGCMLTRAIGKRELRAINLPKGHSSKERFTEIGHFGIFAFFTSLADQFRSNTDPIVIARFMQMAQVTHYNVSYTLIRYFRQIAGQFGTPFLPLFSRFHGRKQQKELTEIFLISSKIQALLTLLIAGAIFGCDEDFMRFWVSDEIGAENLAVCTQLLNILLIPMMLDVMQSLSNTLLYSLNKHPFFTYQTAAEGCANLALSILLAPQYGLLGVAWGTAIPMIITKLIIQPWYVCRVAEIPHLRYLRDCVLFPIGATAVIGWILRTIFHAHEPSNMLILILIGGVISALLTLITALIVLRKRDWAFIAKTFTKRIQI